MDIPEKKTAPSFTENSPQIFEKYTVTVSSLR